MTAPDPIFTIPLSDLDATAALGGALAGALRAGDVVALSGPLGAGKTTLARAIVIAATGEANAPSPTFTLVETYEGGPAPLWHFDLYRLERPEDVYELGLEEAFAEGVSLIEWPERAPGLLPEAALLIRLVPADGARTAQLFGGKAWRSRLAPLLRTAGIADKTR